jgi:hypothetical protein
MSTHNHHEPEEHKPQKIDASLGYEPTDVRVSGIVVFLASMAIFVAVTGIVAYGMGKVINAWMNKQDGPTNKWAATVDIRQLGNLPASPEMQRKVAELTQQFPTPRLQTDDGNQDVADLHQREDLLLNNYSWADQSQGKVRIPIDRAMELIAQRGLPVAPAVQHQALLTGDSEPAVAMPLTNGFVRTGYEQDQAASQAAESRRTRTEK